MPLTMRSTGLGAGIDKDRPDYTVYSGEWAVGRIYETRGGPDNLRWFCGAPSSKYCGRHALGGGTSCTKAVAEPRKRPHFLVGSWLHGGASTRKITKRALFRELPDMKLHRSSPDAHRGRHTWQSRTLSLMKAALKLWSVYANKTRSFVEGCE